MFKQLAAMWRDGCIMKKAVHGLAQMIRDAQSIYAQAWSALSGDADLEDAKRRLHDGDKAVNEAERGIRRILVEHLSVNPGQDVAGCLAIMVMAKDAERIGDLARDIYDLIPRLADRHDAGSRLETRLRPVHEAISAMLAVLPDAIIASDEATARTTLERYRQTKKILKGLVDEVFAADLDSREMATTVLVLRCLRRINAHIGNIASGVIFPVENIDYVSHGLKQERRSD